VRDVRLPTLTEFGAVNRVILQSEAWAIHGPWLRERPGDYGQLSRRRLMAGAFMNAGDYVQAQRRRLEMIAEVEAAFRQVDVLLCASSMDPPCRIDRPADVDRTYPRQARTPFNVTGHPALAMLAGLSVDKLPLSVQFVGRYFEESTLFQVARAWEHAAGTDKKHPPIV
jgi:aspartyl-tRNA(Asn)/glutamyl-tRNA(Gln) amidotransferase subunit A